MGLQEGFLDEIRGVELRLECSADQRPRHEPEVIAVALEQDAQRRAVARAGLSDEGFGSRFDWWHCLSIRSEPRESFTRSHSLRGNERACVCVTAGGGV